MNLNVLPTYVWDNVAPDDVVVVLVVGGERRDHSEPELQRDEDDPDRLQPHPRRRDVAPVRGQQGQNSLGDN